MKKAIVLTYAPISKEEEKLLKSTNVFKIACNWHAENLKPDKRLIADKGIIDKVKLAGNQNIITLLEYYPDERLEDYRHLPKRNSTLPSCVDYLYENGFDEILLVANNKVTNSKPIGQKFQEKNRNYINQLSKVVNIYKYHKEGVLDIPHLSIKDFLNMKKKLTDEERLLGMTEPKPKTLLEVSAFTSAYLYEVQTEGKNNKSIETGDLIKNILPLDLKQKILSGEQEVKYDNLIIKRLTGIKGK